MKMKTSGKRPSPGISRGRVKKGATKRSRGMKKRKMSY